VGLPSTVNFSPSLTSFERRMCNFQATGSERPHQARRGDTAEAAGVAHRVSRVRPFSAYFIRNLWIGHPNRQQHRGHRWSVFASRACSPRSTVGTIYAIPVGTHARMFCRESLSLMTCSTPRPKASPYPDPESSRRLDAVHLCLHREGGPKPHTRMNLGYLTSDPTGT